MCQAQSCLGLLIGEINNTRESTNVPLAISKQSDIYTETSVIVASMWRAQGYTAVFPQTKAYSLKCVATRHAFLKSDLFWLIQIAMMVVRNLPELDDSPSCSMTRTTKASSPC